MSKTNVVMIELDRSRQIKFTHTAIQTACELVGKKVTEIDETISDIDDLEQHYKLLYCGLQYDAKQHGETLPQERIPELLEEAPYFFHSFEKVASAWRVAFGLSPEAPAPEGNEQPATTPEKDESSTGTKASA